MSRSAGTAATGCAWRCARTAGRRLRTIACSSAFAAIPTCACKLETGRTHQIRLHLAHRHYPIVGDPKYGGPAPGAPARARREALIEALRGFKRQALHAATLAFDHPRSGKRLAFESPVPPDFAQLLAALRDDMRDAARGTVPDAVRAAEH